MGGTQIKILLRIASGRSFHELQSHDAGWTKRVLIRGPRRSRRSADGHEDRAKACIRRRSQR